MPTLTRRLFLTSVASLPLAGQLHAAATPYKLDPDTSVVGFTYRLSGASQAGTMPVKTARVAVDLMNLARSSVDVIMDVSRANAGLIFARSAMLGPKVLDAARFPNIRFVSTHVALGKGGRLSDGARVTGDVTIRGVTRPLTLNATLYRRRGSRADDLSQLDFRLQGKLSRKAFGASGYSDLVDDTISLDIRARILRAK